MSRKLLFIIIYLMSAGIFGWLITLAPTFFGGFIAGAISGILLMYALYKMRD